MPNTLLTPSIIAKEALMVLRNNAVMPKLVYRDYSNEFTNVGDTITIRKPATFTANAFTGSGINVQSATETAVPVKMDKHYDVSFEVTAKELTLDIEDFSKQFLVPAMQAFADKIDADLIALQSSVTQRTTATTARADIVSARKELTNASAPLADRAYVVNADIEANMLLDDVFVTAEKVGDAGTALREASVGRRFGADIYVDQNIATASGTGDPMGIMFHKNAFALVTRPLALPLGNSNAEIVDYDGFALRVVRDYDINNKKDIISIDMLCGVEILDAKLASVVQK